LESKTGGGSLDNEADDGAKKPESTDATVHSEDTNMSSEEDEDFVRIDVLYSIVSCDLFIPLNFESCEVPLLYFRTWIISAEFVMISEQPSSVMNVMETYFAKTAFMNFTLNLERFISQLRLSLKKVRLVNCRH
jgi:hypothetical protein